MTMTRTEKQQHEAELKSAALTGYTIAEFQSPDLRAAAKAERGHARMTMAEYVEHMMLRGEAHEGRIIGHIERRQRAHRAARVVGGRRVNARR